MKYEVPYIEIAGIAVLEPFTVLTNLLIAGICFFSYGKLKKEKFNHNVFRFFRLFLLLMGVATTIGGIVGHGFLYIWGEGAKIPGWYFSMVSIAMFERTAIIHSRPLMNKFIGDFFSVLNIIELCVFLVVTFITLKFGYVEIHAIYGLFVVVFSFEMYVFYKTKDTGCLYLFAGTLLAAIAGTIHGFRISINEWFNYNDLSHIFMAVGVYYYYLFASKLTVHQIA